MVPARAAAVEILVRSSPTYRKALKLANVGSRQSRELALNVLQDGVLRRDPHCEYALGNWHFYGVCVRRDRAKGVRLFARAARAGVVAAASELASCYEKGTGVAKDRPQAFYWYRKAAEGGDVDSLNEVGRCLRYGIGTRKNPVAAFESFHAAALRGNAKAQYSVAFFYEKGEGASQSLRWARHWYVRSAALGLARAVRAMRDDIEHEIAQEDWVVARKRIRAALRNEPGSHWLLTRLALTYYEEHSYGVSLKYATQALAIEPSCPLALWEQAGALSMLGKSKEGVRIYRRLIRRGVDSIAHGDCGEGLARARGLVADCWYRVALCQRTSGSFVVARNSLRRHLALRGPGCRSIYPLQQVKYELLATRA